MSFEIHEMGTRIDQLIRRCAEAYTHGRSQANPSLNMDEKHNVQFFLAMMMHGVSLLEISTILSASQIRARALALSRTGEFMAAQSALDDARSTCAEAGLSKEAAVADDSFRQSAEAYLQYKTRDYARAEASLRQALECCRTLREQFGYAVEGRRIYLVRNIIRVRAFAGKSEDAFDMACLLVRYVEGEAECWPLQELDSGTKPDTLAHEDRSLLLDQILSEISLLLANPAKANSLLTRAPAALFSEPFRFEREISRARVRLSAIRAVTEHDLIGFLQASIVFFWDGVGYMPQAWREMSREFIGICQEVAPDAVATLTEE